MKTNRVNLIVAWCAVGLVALSLIAGWMSAAIIGTLAAALFFYLGGIRRPLP